MLCFHVKWVLHATFVSAFWIANFKYIVFFLCAVRCTWHYQFSLLPASNIIRTNFDCNKVYGYDEYSTGYFFSFLYAFVLIYRTNELREKICTKCRCWNIKIIRTHATTAQNVIQDSRREIVLFAHLTHCNSHPPTKYVALYYLCIFKLCEFYCAA